MMEAAGFCENTCTYLHHTKKTVTSELVAQKVATVDVESFKAALCSVFNLKIVSPSDDKEGYAQGVSASALWLAHFVNELCSQVSLLIIKYLNSSALFFYTHNTQLFHIYLEQ
jgi:hypothetical protein